MNQDLELSRLRQDFFGVDFHYSLWHYAHQINSYQIN